MQRKTGEPKPLTNPDYNKEVADEAVRLAQEELEQDSDEMYNVPDEQPVFTDKNLPEGSVQFDEQSTFYEQPESQQNVQGDVECPECEPDDPRLDMLREFGVEVNQKTLAFADEFLKGKKNYKELQGEFTRRSQKLAGMEEEELPNDIDIDKLLGPIPTQGYNASDFEKEAFDEMGNIKSKEALVSAMNRFVSAASDLKGREMARQVASAIDIRNQYKEVFDAYPDEAKKHFSKYMKHISAHKPTLLEGFEFYLFRNNGRTSRNEPKNVQSQTEHRGARGRINKNVHKKASIAGIPNQSVRRQVEPDQAYYENFFGEQF